MATIIEDYVSFEVAKLLKEKGFNCSCEHQYINCSSGHPFLTDIRDDAGCYYKNSEIGQDEYSAPTLQMAMKWLRLERGIAIIPIISSVLDNEKFLWDVEITVAKTNETYNQGWVYEIYEEACEAAIKYCITNLI